MPRPKENRDTYLAVFVRTAQRTDLRRQKKLSHSSVPLTALTFVAVAPPFQRNLPDGRTDIGTIGYFLFLLNEWSDGRTDGQNMNGKCCFCLGLSSLLCLV